MKRTLLSKTGRHKTGKTKCRQIGRVPDVVWRSVLRGFRASDAQNFTKWAAAALIKQAKADMQRRRELDKIATTILQEIISGKPDNLAPKQERLKVLLAEEPS